MIDVSLKLTMFTNVGVLYFASRNFSSLYYYGIGTTNYILLTTYLLVHLSIITQMNNTILYWRNSISNSARAPPVDEANILKKQLDVSFEGKTSSNHNFKRDITVRSV